MENENNAVKQPDFPVGTSVRTKRGLRSRGRFLPVKAGTVEEVSYPYSNKSVLFYWMVDTNGLRFCAHESDLERA